MSLLMMGCAVSDYRRAERIAPFKPINRRFAPPFNRPDRPRLRSTLTRPSAACAGEGSKTKPGRITYACFVISNEREEPSGSAGTPARRPVACFSRYCNKWFEEIKRGVKMAQD